jgi:hypothetical protein
MLLNGLGRLNASGITETWKRERGDIEGSERGDGAAFRDRARQRRGVQHDQREETDDDDALAEHRPSHGQEAEWIRWSYCSSNSV